jgi:hypothetical protein
MLLSHTTADFYFGQNNNCPPSLNINDQLQVAPSFHRVIDEAGKSKQIKYTARKKIIPFIQLSR